MRSSFLLLAFLSALPCSAQNTLKSAREILELAPQKTGSETEYAPEPTSKTSALGLWRRDALLLRQNAAKNSAKRNAQLWFELAARRLEIPRENSTTYERRPEWKELVRALPTPRDWAEIHRLARANYAASPGAKNAAKWVFAARLRNEPQSQIEALRALYRLETPRFAAALKKYPLPSAGSKTNREYRDESQQREALARFRSLAALLGESPDFAQQVAGINWQLELVPRGSEYDDFSVPDLVSRLGTQSATPLVQKILRSRASLSWYNAGKTLDLARKIWMSDAKSQTRPQWELASSVKDPKFALAMIERFPKPDPDSSEGWEVNQVRSLALGGLVASGNVAGANRWVARWLKAQPSGAGVPFPESDLKSSSSRVAQTRLLTWVETTLRKHPQLNWFGGYREVSLRAGQTPRRLQLLKSLANEKGFETLPVARRHTLLSALSAAYLDSDDAKNGGDTLVRALQISLKAKNSNELDGEVTALLRLTRLMPQAKWSQAAMRGARAMFAPKTSEEYDAAPKRVRVALRLAEQNQLVLAQSLLASAFQNDLKARSKQEYDGDSSTPRTHLLGLMEIFRRANRPADMVYLLDNARDWGHRDLEPLLLFDGSGGWDYDTQNPESKTRPRLGYLAAWALAKTGRRAQAAQITRALIERQSGYDAAYRLLCDLEGQNARPFLQKMAAADRFEERPLIWQAFLARRAGKWQEAQRLAKGAIAIDPSDGEQGPNDRLRAYSELGAALRGQGKKSQATEVETAVGAIRLAERADYERIAGLTPRAIANYERSLRFFDAAYCTQSRLAVQLTSVGRYAEAGAHFRRAYELMPASFGRLESHCFGCEGVFGGQEQNSIAREVFLQLERARPRDAKIAYLSGYWRQTAKQEREAARYFLRAVELDPLYLSAWKQLASHSEFLTPAQSDRATLALIELDPRGTHQGGSVSFEVERDYRGLWRVTERVLGRTSLKYNPNYRLKASKNPEGWSEERDSWESVKTPADAIAGQPIVTRIADLVG